MREERESQGSVGVGLSSAQLDAIHRLGRMLPVIIQEFDWYGLKQFIKIRASVLGVLEREFVAKGKHGNYAAMLLKDKIEGNLLRVLHKAYQALVVESVEGGVKQYSVRILEPGSSLIRVLNFSTALVLSMRGMSRVLERYIDGFEHNKNSVDMFLSARSRGCLKKIIMQIRAIFPSMRCAINKLSKEVQSVRRELRDDLAFNSIHVELKKTAGVYGFKVSSMLLASDCLIKSDIELDEHIKKLSGITFDDVTLQSSHFGLARELTLDKCRGKVRLRCFQGNSQLSIIGSPELEVLIEDGAYKSLSVEKGIKAIVVKNTQLTSVNFSGSANKINFDDCRVEEFRVGSGRIIELGLTRSKSQLCITQGTQVGVLGISSGSQCPLKIRDSEVAEFRVTQSAVQGCLENSSIGEICFDHSLSNNQPKRLVYRSLLSMHHMKLGELMQSQDVGGLYRLEKVEGVDGHSVIICAQVQNRLSLPEVRVGQDLTVAGGKRVKGMSELLNSEDLLLLFERLSHYSRQKNMCPRHHFWDATALAMAAIGVDPMKTLWGVQESNSTICRYAQSAKKKGFSSMHLLRILESFVLWRHRYYPDVAVSRVALLPLQRKIFFTEWLEQKNAQEARRRRAMRQRLQIDDRVPAEGTALESKTEDARRRGGDFTGYISLRSQALSEQQLLFLNDRGARSAEAGIKVLTYAFSIIQSCPVNGSWLSSRLEQFKIQLMSDLEVIIVSGFSVKKKSRLCIDAIQSFESDDFFQRVQRECFHAYTALAKLILCNYLSILKKSEQANKAIAALFTRYQGDPFIERCRAQHEAWVQVDGLTDAAISTLNFLYRNQSESPCAENEVSRVRSAVDFEGLIRRKQKGFLLVKHINKMARIAKSYRPIFGFFGLGRRKRLVLLYIVNLLKNEQSSVNERLFQVNSVLSFLTQDSPVVPVERNKSIQGGANLWERHSRRSSGYRSHVFLLKELSETLKKGNPSWPSAPRSKKMLHNVRFYQDVMHRAQNRVLRASSFRQ